MVNNQLLNANKPSKKKRSRRAWKKLPKIPEIMKWIPKKVLPVRSLFLRNARKGNEVSRRIQSHFLMLQKHPYINLHNIRGIKVTVENLTRTIRLTSNVEKNKSQKSIRLLELNTFIYRSPHLDMSEIFDAVDESLRLRATG